MGVCETTGCGKQNCRDLIEEELLGLCLNMPQF